jgi:hypothetical protein
VSGKQVRYKNIFCPQKEEDLTSQIILVYFHLVYFPISVCNLLKYVPKTAMMGIVNYKLERAQKEAGMV